MTMRNWWVHWETTHPGSTTRFSGSTQVTAATAEDARTLFKQGADGYEIMWVSL